VAVPVYPGLVFTSVKLDPGPAPTALARAWHSPLPARPAVQQTSYWTLSQVTVDGGWPPDGTGAQVLDSVYHEPICHAKPVLASQVAVRRMNCWPVSPAGQAAVCELSGIVGQVGDGVGVPAGRGTHTPPESTKPVLQLVGGGLKLPMGTQDPPVQTSP